MPIEAKLIEGWTLDMVTPRKVIELSHKRELSQLDGNVAEKQADYYAK